MQKLILLSLLATVVLGQGPEPPSEEFVIDSIHGFRVEYDDQNNIILFVNNEECYIIEAVDSTWDQIVRNIEDLHTVTDEIYAQIQDERGITSLDQAVAEELYSSNLEEWECREKDVHQVRYTPDI